tara:strand:+ start:976 stop:1644 length:669 start_codon:yes stop_codon:yes gene_type:complete
MINKKINLIFDFDSTFIQLETIEVLAEFALSNNKNKTIVLNKIKDITDLAMSGKISFKEALSNRISMLNLDQKHIERTSEFIKRKTSKSFISNINFFKKNFNNIYIVSGGFKSIIYSTIKQFNIIESNIYANDFLNINNKVTIDSNNPLSMDNGKSMVIKNIDGFNIIIGDGYTDYEVKKNGFADIFIQYIENINRKELNDKADFIAKNFNEIINFIKNIEK